MNRLFYQRNGEPYQAYAGHPGLSSICKMIDFVEDKADLWLVYELCGQPLTKMLFTTKGQFWRGERIYEVRQDPIIYQILEANDFEQFKLVIQRILQGLSLLKLAGIVHCDLKSENILVEVDKQNKEIKSVKIIDFGTSFDFSSVNRSAELTTPEYLPPELLEFLETK